MTRRKGSNKTATGTKKKTSVRKPQARETTFFQRMETGIWGLGIGLLGLLLFISLAFYEPLDFRGVVGEYNNPIGPLGAWLSHLVYYLLGFGALALAVSCVTFGAFLIGQRSLRLTLRKLAGFAALLIPSMVILELALPKGDPACGLPGGGGGLVGFGLAWVFQALIGQIGTIIVAIAGLIVGVSLLFRIHVRAFFLVPWRMLRGTVERIPLPSMDREPRAEPSEDSADERSEDSSGLTPFRPADESGPLSKPVISRPQAELLEKTSAQRPRNDDSLTDSRALDAATVARKPRKAPARAGTSVPIIAPTKPAADMEHLDEEDVTSPQKGRAPVIPKPARKYERPDLSLLDYHPPVRQAIDDEALQDSARLVVEKLKDFKVDGEVVGIHPGPVITLYEFRPGRGVKVSQVANLSKDLAMAVAAEQVRVIAPIPGRDVVGIEIPNKVRETVYLRELLTNKKYQEGKYKLPLALGKDIAGFPVIADMTKMPHLLVAGTTGSGKSVALHSLIQSILFKLPPERAKFLFVDPKMLEFTSYAEIPHLLLPVVTEARDAVVGLRWLVGEMERRNRTMSMFSVPNISEYNDIICNIKNDPKVGEQLVKSTSGPAKRRLEDLLEDGELEEFPYIILVIDELADLMMVAGKQVEQSIARLAQMARAAGIHMIIATQNPTIKVVTGIIKANMPARLSFKVRSMQDSRVILDQNGADDLLGWGDMLFLPPGSSKLQRIHGGFVSTEERMRVVDHLRTQGAPEYNMDIMQATEDAVGEEEEDNSVPVDSREQLYKQAKQIAAMKGKISTSALQRELGIGYNKAATLMARMEKDGVVGPQESAGKPREVLI